MAQLLKTSYQLPELDYDMSKDWRQSDHEKAFKKLCEENTVIQIPHADGFACYLVVSESPLVLQHVPYGDAWHAPAAHIRGLRKKDIEGMIRRREMGFNF
jgi:acetoacetate decarboxylase